MRSLLLAGAIILTGCAHRGTTAEPASDQGAVPPRPGIARVWHGRVPAARADAYAAYLAAAIAKFHTLPGNLGYEMLRDDAGPETHFMVLSYWTTKDAIRAYAGDDITKTRSLPRDPEFLIEAEPTVQNYAVAVQDLAR